MYDIDINRYELYYENFFVCVSLSYIVSRNIDIPTENPRTDFSSIKNETAQNEQ